MANLAAARVLYPLRPIITPYFGGSPLSQPRVAQGAQEGWTEFQTTEPTACQACRVGFRRPPFLAACSGIPTTPDPASEALRRSRGAS